MGLYLEEVVVSLAKQETVRGGCESALLDQRLLEVVVSLEEHEAWLVVAR